MKPKNISKAAAHGALAIAIGASMMPLGAIGGGVPEAEAAQARPARVKVKSVKATDSTLKIKLRKAKNASGYQYKVSKLRSFASKGKVKTKKTTKTSCVFSNLESGAKYYVKARAYKKTKTGKIWGKWSKVASRMLLTWDVENSESDAQHVANDGSARDASDQATQSLADQERAAREKAEQEAAAQQKAQQEAVAKQKAEQEAAAKQEAEKKAAEEKAKQEAAARQKAQEEKAAQEKAKQEAAAKQKAAEEAAAKQKAEEEAAAKQKAEEEAAAKEKAEQEKTAAKEKAEQEKAAAEQAEKDAIVKNVEQYSYEVQPIIAPFNNLIYVKTDNPDPKSFKIQDKSSSLADESEEGSGTFKLYEGTFLDVAYEDKATYRVNGGYIFYDRSCDSDGGDLTVLANLGNEKFTDTSVMTACPTLTTSTQYLLDTYTNDSMTFFEKLDAVQSALNAIALYPKSICDTDKPSSRPYPMLTVSPHKDIIMNRRYDIMFEDTEETALFYAAYPFVLDSWGVPGTISAIAKKLNPNCTVKADDYYHYLIQVTADGETKYYGGAGVGGTSPFYSKYIGTNYTFDGSDGDLGTSATLEMLRDKYSECNKLSKADMETYVDQLTGETFANAIGEGSWVKVGAEGWFGLGESTAYIAAGASAGTTSTAVDAWVDGRYINSYAQWAQGEKFADHSTTDIIVRDMSYTDYRGKAHKQDVVFEYNETTQRWEALQYYVAGGGYRSNIELPEEFILTKDEVEAMGIDANTDVEPEHGLIYDGTAEPGTAY